MNVLRYLMWQNETLIQNKHRAGMLLFCIAVVLSVENKSLTTFTLIATTSTLAVLYSEILALFVQNQSCLFPVIVGELIKSNFYCSMECLNLQLWSM